MVRPIDKALSWEEVAVLAGHEVLMVASRTDLSEQDRTKPGPGFQL